MKSNTEFALKGNIIYSETPQTISVTAGGYVICDEDGRSAGVFAELPERYKDICVRDCANALVIPGLCDLHLHAPQYAFRGLGMDLELLDWLNTHTFPEEAKYSDLEYAKKAYTIFADAMQQGATTRACVFATVHLPATELLMELLDRTGIKAMVGKVNMDRNSPDSLCESGAAASLADTERWLDECVGSYKNITPILTPRFIPSCTDELMRGLAKLQKQTGLPVQSHLSENLSEVAWVKELCPDSTGYGDAYDRFGLFGGERCPTIMAHCVHSDDAEIELMAQRGVFVAHCAQSNTNLASGIAPVRKYLNRGMHIGLGTDVAGGFTASIFRAMSDAVQVSKLRWRLVDDTLAPLTVPEAFYLGTKGGGEFFGKVGSLEAGYEFDAVVIDDRSFKSPSTLTPLERLERMVYLGGAHNVSEKYVSGTRVKG